MSSPVVADDDDDASRRLVVRAKLDIGGFLQAAPII